jgi:hypothetical protein
VFLLDHRWTTHYCIPGPTAIFPTKMRIDEPPLDNIAQLWTIFSFGPFGRPNRRISPPPLHLRGETTTGPPESLVASCSLPVAVGEAGCGAEWL